MPSKPSAAFMKIFSRVLLGMNAFAALTVAMSFVLGYGTPELRWQWVWQLGLSLAVLATLLVMVRQAERREDRKT
jgi:hypothetical protein